MFDVIKEILISEKEFNETNYKRLQEASGYIGNSFVDSDGGMYLTVDSLIEINNLVTGSNHITLRKVNVKSYGLDKMYMEKELIEDKLYQMIYQFNEKKNYIYKVLFNTLKQNYIHFMMEIVEHVRYCLLMMI